MLRRKAISYWRNVPHHEFLIAISISIMLCSGLAAIGLFLPQAMKSAAIESGLPRKYRCCRSDQDHTGLLHAADRGEGACLQRPDAQLQPRVRSGSDPVTGNIRPGHLGFVAREGHQAFAGQSLSLASSCRPRHGRFPDEGLGGFSGGPVHDFLQGGNAQRTAVTARRGVGSYDWRNMRVVPQYGSGLARRRIGSWEMSVP